MDLLTGEPLLIDLLNTRAVTASGEIDALDSTADFTAWLEAQSGRLAARVKQVDADLLKEVRALREQARVVVDAARTGLPPPRAAIDALNAAVRRAPAYTIAAVGDDDITAKTRRDGDATARLLAEFADAAVALLTSADIRKVRACEGPRCRMLFLPAHPRRRWCSPERCGNRVRVARYYERHKV